MAVFFCCQKEGNHINFKSFKTWCFENNAQNLLDRWDYELNKIDPCDVKQSDKISYWFKCPSNQHPSTKRYLPKVKIYGCICKYCNSFKQWCINNNRKDLLNRWDYTLNEESPENVSYHSVSSYYFVCPDKIHYSQKVKIHNITKHQGGIALICNECNSLYYWCLQNNRYDIIDRWDSELNKIDIKSISKHSGKTIWLKCQNKIHNSEEFGIHYLCENPDAQMLCKQCNSFGYHIFAKFGEEKLVSIWDYNKNKKSPFDYSRRSQKKVWWKCEKHGSYYRSIEATYVYDCRCPICVSENDSSILQSKVGDYISNILQYNVFHENYCTIVPKNPNTNHVLPFDNEIVDLKLIIEVHGSQHYELNYWHKLSAKQKGTSCNYEFEYQKWKDAYKKECAIAKGYYFLEIPYWTDDENETWKTLIINRVNEIQQSIKAS